MRDLSNRMVNGVDVDQDGTVEPVAGEGGVWTAFLTAQRTADYFPSGAIGGLIQHQPSSQNPTSDRIAIALSKVPQPPNGVTLWAYLLGEGGTRLVLGELLWDNGAVTASFSHQGRNLIGEFHFMLGLNLERTDWAAAAAEFTPAPSGPLVLQHPVVAVVRGVDDEDAVVVRGLMSRREQRIVLVLPGQRRGGGRHRGVHGARAGDEPGGVAGRRLLQRRRDAVRGADRAAAAR